MVPFETGTAYGYAPNAQFNSHSQHNASGSYTQPNVLQSNASTTPMPTTTLEVIDRFNANLAILLVRSKKIKIFHIENRILLVLIRSLSYWLALS
jgi:hypothetical protein